MLLANRNPRLEKLTLDLLEAERKRTSIDYRRSSIGVYCVLVGLKITPRSLAKNSVCPSLGDPRKDVSPQRLQWLERWRSTSTLQDNSRTRHHLCLLKLGRWVTAVHPACVSPERWTREIAAELFVTAAQGNVSALTDPMLWFSV